MGSERGRSRNTKKVGRKLLGYEINSLQALYYSTALTEFSYKRLGSLAFIIFSEILFQNLIGRKAQSPFLN